MTKKELRKISLQYRTLSSQMLKIDSQEEVNYIQMFYDYITNTPVIFDYIQKCSTTKYDFKEIFARKEWNDILTLPSSQEELVGYGYQLLQYVLDGPKQLFVLGRGYTGSNKFKDAKLVFIVLRNEDCQYYKTPKANGIAANVYSTEGQTSYSIFWKHQENELQKQIEELGDPTYAITQIKEKKVIRKILLDLPEFIEFVRDSKGLSLTEHIAHNFSDIIKFMNL